MKLSRSGCTTFIVMITCAHGLSLSALAWASPHVPHEGDLEQKKRGLEPNRNYQADSAERFTSTTSGGVHWIREKLASVHLTPARLSIGLGAVGLLVSWSRNKKLIKWAVISAFSWLLLALGGAAMVFDWPHMN